MAHPSPDAGGVPDGAHVPDAHAKPRRQSPLLAQLVLHMSPPHARKPGQSRAGPATHIPAPLHVRSTCFASAQLEPHEVAAAGYEQTERRAPSHRPQEGTRRSVRV